MGPQIPHADLDKEEDQFVNEENCPEGEGKKVSVCGSSGDGCAITYIQLRPRKVRE